MRGTYRLVFVLAIVLSIGVVGCSSSSWRGGKSQSDSEFSDQDLALGEEARWGDGNIPLAQEDGLFKDLFFDFDSSVVLGQYQEDLRRNAEVLQGDSTLHAEVEGHCDKRGTNEYNLALGEQRARAVAAILVSFGVSPSQISTISYGEEIPVDPGDSEEAWAKNRRVHFALYRRNQ